jgi:2,3-bisphosphoglycerate-independent phosphoglycerate mutase
MEPHFVLIILDGLSDRPGPAGTPPTPLEAARTPNLDRLAAEGEVGRVMIIGPGLGYDPVRDSPGRGVLEALGAGLPLSAGDVAFRLNFATADGDGRIADSRVGRDLSTRESTELGHHLTEADLLADEGIQAEVRPTVGHRGVLWLHPTRGGALSGEVSNSDPFYEKVGGMGQARSVREPRPLEIRPLAPTEAARRTARAANQFLSRAGPILASDTVNARRALAGKKVANALLIRNAGSLPEPGPPGFAERHGRPGVAVTEMPVERGIARLFGLGDRYVGPMGPDRDASLRERARVTREALESSPFVYVHLKGPDEPGHDGDADRKREIIEALDRAFFGPFLTGLDPAAVRLVVTADHSTPAALRGHSDDPVPLLLWGAGVEGAGAPVNFGERLCSEPGRLGVLPARSVLPLLFAGTLPPTRA